jgi:hypothetical protein
MQIENVRLFSEELRRKHLRCLDVFFFFSSVTVFGKTYFAETL